MMNTKIISELSTPCPFCGSKGFIVYIDGYFYALCDTCTCRVKGDTEWSATANWDNRSEAYRRLEEAALKAAEQSLQEQSRNVKQRTLEDVLADLVIECDERYDEGKLRGDLFPKYANEIRELFGVE